MAGVPLWANGARPAAHWEPFDHLDPKGNEQRPGAEEAGPDSQESSRELIPP